MKKILCVVVMAIMLIGCKTSSNKLNIQGIQEINYEKLIQNLNSDVTFMLYIGRPDCGDCQAFYPILEDYMESHPQAGVYYVNVKEWKESAMKEEASLEEKDFVEHIYEKLDFDWTPTMQVIRNGKVISRYQYLDEQYFEIDDREKQIQKKQEFLDEFEKFMNNYLEEE